MKLKKDILKSLKKPYIIIFTVLVICLFMFSHNQNIKKPDATDRAEDVTQLEIRLKNILSKIQGAGRVEVMITLESEGEKIILKDNQANDTGGLFGTDPDTLLTEKTVMQKDGSKEEPFVRKHTKAEVRGVIVCADGADDQVVKSEIISSCTAVLDVPVTRVSVVKRKE